MLNQLTITGFRGIDDMTLDLTGRDCLVGANGSGKTTVLSAINMLLFGKCDVQGRKMSSLIRAGHMEARVVGVFTVQEFVNEGNRYILEVKAELTMGFKKSEFALVNTKTGELISDRREGLLHMLEWSPTACRVACNPQHFLGGADMSKVLVEDLGVSMEANRAADYILDHLQDEDYLVSVNDYCADFSRNHNDGQPPTHTHHWDDIGKRAYDERTQDNKDLAAIKEALVGNFATQPKDATGKRLDADDKDKLKEYVRQNAEALRELQDERAGAEAIARVLAELEPGQDIIGLKSELDSIGASTAELSLKLQQSNQELAELTVKRSELRDQFDSADSRRNQAQRDLDDAEGRLKHAKEDDACEACCRVWDEEARSKAIKRADLHRNKLIQRLDIFKEEVDTIDESLTAIDAALVAKDGEIDGYTRQSASLESKITIVSEKIKCHTTNTRPIPDIDSDIAIAQSNYDDTQRLLVDLEKWLGRCSLQTQQMEIEARVEVLTWCCEHFKKGLFQQWCIAGPLDEFCADVSAVLEDTGYYIGHASEGGKGIELTLSRPGSEDYFPLKDCSRGEQVLAGLAISKCFAAKGGGLSLVDNLDALDDDNRAAALRLITESTTPLIGAMASHGEQVDGLNVIEMYAELAGVGVAHG